MVEREVFDSRLGRLEELLRKLRRLAENELEDYLNDDGLQAQAERWLHLAAECALDLAHHLIADQGYRTPDSYRDAFAVLREQGVLDAELAGHMQAWAGLRNVLVHLYLEVDQRILHGVLRDSLDQLADYAAALVAAFDDR